MLSLPASGFRRSRSVHNVDIDICCDWIEASSMFLHEEISGADVVDLLRENEIYADQDFAWELVNDVVGHLRDRARLLGDGYPIQVSHHGRIVPKGAWADYTAYGFCLLLSLPVAYPAWAEAFGADYNQQGELFEKLTAEAVKASLAGWTVHSTGWTRSAPNNLTQVVRDVAAMLGESIGEVAKWTKQRAHEAGLDLLCFRAFPDGRVGVPVFLVQCASGGDWKKKLKTPDLRIWGKAITFASDPKKAFSMPFALSESDFTFNCNIVDGLLLDRHRLLAPGVANAGWISGALRAELTAWMTPRITALPVDDAGE
jgi:hypothetical protein